MWKPVLLSTQQCDFGLLDRTLAKVEANDIADGPDFIGTSASLEFFDHNRAVPHNLVRFEKTGFRWIAKNFC
jgi:hypothetical protein